MAWPKKIRSLSIEPAAKGMMSTPHPAEYSGKSPLPTFHPNVAHLQAHIGKLFGAKKATGGSALRAGTPRSATNAGGGGIAPSPAQAKIASSMLGS
jgi:hypothetical protein